MSSSYSPGPLQAETDLIDPGPQWAKGCTVRRGGLHQGCGHVLTGGSSGREPSSQGRSEREPRAESVFRAQALDPTDQLASAHPPTAPVRSRMSQIRETRGREGESGHGKNAGRTEGGPSGRCGIKNKEEARSCRDAGQSGPGGLQSTQPHPSTKGDFRKLAHLFLDAGAADRPAGEVRITHARC